MDNTNQSQPLIDTIRQQIGTQEIQLGILLGSGLGGIADKIKNKTTFSYADLPGFPEGHVKGHTGELIIGELNNTSVACLNGRAHLYEGTPPSAVCTMIRCLKLLGCKALLLTNAAGSLHKEVTAGSLMLIEDHINFQGTNPLVGPNDDDFGPRFVAMDNAYDKVFRNKLKTLAKELSIPLATGTYLATLGPVFETPAEIRAFRTLGADAVGMSTVAEVIVAAHCSLRVAAISAITNLAADINPTPLSHEETLRYGKIASEDLTRLVLRFVAQL